MKKLPTLSSSFCDFIEKNINENKVSKFLFKLGTMHARNYQLPYKLLTTNEIDYLTMRTDGTISYLPKGKPHLTNEETGAWQRDGRQNGKPSKVIKKIFTPLALKMFNDTDFETFANLYKAESEAGQTTFEILDSIKINDVYDMDRSEGGAGLNNSCMNNNGNYMDIYNTDKIKIIVLKNKAGKLCGRALLWQVTNEIQLVDRIYCAKDEQYNLFIDFIKENKFHYKKDYRTYNNKTTFIDSEGNEYKQVYTINVGTFCDYYPYIDTFCYGGDGYLTNDEDNETCYTYQSTCGDREERNTDYYCEVSHEYIDEDDARYIERGQYRGHYIHYDHAVWLQDLQEYMYDGDSDVVEIDGDYYHISNDNIVEIDGNYYFMDSDEICFCEDTEEYCLTEDCIYVENGNFNGYYQRENVREVCGNYFHIDDIKEL
jgi:hypothetical protein